MPNFRKIPLLSLPKSNHFASVVLCTFDFVGIAPAHTIELSFNCHRSQKNSLNHKLLLSHADRFVVKLAHCRGIRHMQLHMNMSACEQAPADNSYETAHSSL